MASVGLGRRFAILPPFGFGQKSALCLHFRTTFSSAASACSPWSSDGKAGSLQKASTCTRYQRLWSTGFLGDSLRGSLTGYSQIQAATAGNETPKHSSLQTWRRLVTRGNTSLQEWTLEDSWPLGDTETRRRKRYGQHVERKKKEAKKKRKAAAKGVPLPPVRAPANGMVVRELIPVAHRTLAARAALIEGVERLLQALPAFACSSCPEVYVGAAGHQIRSCTGKDMHARRGAHVWMAATLHDVLGERESYHLEDRLKTQVHHDHRHNTPRVPAVVELCIQAGVDIAEYPTVRRSKPFEAGSLGNATEASSDGESDEEPRPGEGRSLPGAGGWSSGLQVGAGGRKAERPAKEWSIEERLREEVWDSNGDAQDPAEGEAQGSALGAECASAAVEDGAPSRLGVLPGSAERDSLGEQAISEDAGREGGNEVLTGGSLTGEEDSDLPSSHSEASSLSDPLSDSDLEPALFLGGTRNWQQSSESVSPLARGGDRRQGGAGPEVRTELRTKKELAKEGNSRDWEQPWQQPGQPLPALLDDPDLKRVAERTLAAWTAMRAGVARLLTKYPVLSCGYCPEVHVAPRGHKVRLCDAAKHQWRRGLHGWQDAILDDIVPPKYVWHIRDGEPHLHELRHYYGMAPAVLELCVQAGAAVPEAYKPILREDVVVPEVEELGLVL